MNVKIIHSGSSGNCAVIDDTIIIDCGWKDVPPGHIVLLTHAHTDHTKWLQNAGGMTIYATEETADRLSKKFPYIEFETLRAGTPLVYEVPYTNVEETFNFMGQETDYWIRSLNAKYIITSLSVKHDVNCVAFDIVRTSPGDEEKRIFFGTDFSQIYDDGAFVRDLQNKRYDALYIECNNTLNPSDLMDLYITDEPSTPPKDEFHRRRSYHNHCNVGYLISLFERAGYSETNKFTEPVTLLHKSSYYYQTNQQRIVDLCKIANVINPLYE